MKDKKLKIYGLVLVGFVAAFAYDNVFFTKTLPFFGTSLALASNSANSTGNSASNASSNTSSNTTSNTTSSNSASNASSNTSSNTTSNTTTSNSASSSASGSTKATICHIPPGNPENAKSISISMNALQAHQDHHQDTLGECATISSSYSDGLFRIIINVPIKINPAQNSSNDTDLTQSDFTTWTSAAAIRTSTSDTYPWPSGYSDGWGLVASAGGAKNPRGVTLTSYPAFGPIEDMPALMLSAGVLDIHNSANISGAVYNADFVEIEQKQESSEVQYLNGAIIGGNGIYLESNSCGGGIAVLFDPDTLDSLNVNAVSTDALKKKGWRVVE